MQSRKYIKHPKAFTRESKLGYEKTAMFLLSPNKRSLAVELSDYFAHFGESSVSSSAICQSRDHISYELFSDLNAEVIRTYYTEMGDRAKQWSGFRLLGIDGSLLQLFTSPKVTAYFDTYHSQTMARQLFFCDVLNEVCVHTEVASNRKSEEYLLEKAFPWLKQNQKDFGPVLCIYDRGFPSFSSFYQHQQAGIEFVMRCSTTFNKEVKEFLASEKTEDIVRLHAPQTSTSSRKKLKKIGYPLQEDPGIEVRLIRVELSSGETEVLVTSLLDMIEYPASEFQALYFLRWKSETFIDYWKEKMQIEQFSSIKVNGVLQDIFAQMVLANLHHIFVQKIDEKVEQRTREKQCKYSYKTNKNIGVAILKKWLPLLILGLQPEVFLNNIETELERHLVPIRPGRSFPRNKRQLRHYGKTQTFTNHRRSF